MDRAVDLLIGILNLVILGPDPIWTKIVLVVGLFVWFIVSVGVVCFVIAFVTIEAKRFSSRIHSR